MPIHSPRSVAVCNAMPRELDLRRPRRVAENRHPASASAAFRGAASSTTLIITGQPMRLSVLDQSPIISGHTPAQAMHETIRLAKAVEQLGYHRYWLAEHHSIAALADPCPEILLTRMAAETSTLRVGTGGILLPYYSPFKVAEQFRMLEALYPGRMDLGIGRAPGGDRTTALAMGEGRYPGAEHFAEQVQYLVAYLDDALPAGSPVRGSEGDAGGADRAAGLAARLVGLQRRARGAARPALCVRAFHQRGRRREVMRDYKRRYQPSQREPAPASLLCVFAICAEIRRGSGAARGQHRPAPAQHGSRGQRAGAELRGGRAPTPTPRPTAGASRTTAAASCSARPDTVRARLLELAAGIRSRRIDGHHHHRRLRQPAEDRTNCSPAHSIWVSRVEARALMAEGAGASGTGVLRRSRRSSIKSNELRSRG